MAGGGMGYAQIAQAGFGALFTHQFKSRSKRAAKAAYAARIAALNAAKGVVQKGKEATTGYLTSGYDAAKSEASTGFNLARSDISAGADLARGSINKGYDAAIAGQSAYRETGKRGLATLETLLSNADSIANTSAYKWALGQGLDALDRAQGAAGKRLSGQGLKEITDYGQGLASQQYQNVFKNTLDTIGIGERAEGIVSNLEAERGTSLANIDTTSSSNLANIAQSQGLTLADIEKAKGTSLAANEYNFTQDLANIELGYGGVAGQLASDKMNIEQQFTDYRFKVLDSATSGVQGGIGGSYGK